MISDIVISGRLGQMVNSYLRELIIEKENIITSNVEKTIIPISDWFKSTNGFLLTLPIGTHVLIRGRIEKDEEHGLFVITETLEIISKDKLLSF
ncbi:hypothetical protein SDC9_173240 [bioreactor metagenome]|uniref:Single-stranded DNA-binding protein n=1 Tax=bioreactor metagenome TaxID=1076179 RepID=A0A645GPF0_9ZZZZ|nr:hypothetical protein [Erysipelotrichaceae bacterium]